MEIIKRKSGFRYREMLWANGQSIKSPVFSKKSDCRQWLANQKANKANLQLYGHSSKLYSKTTLSEYCTSWLLTKQSQQVARSTMKNYESYVRVHIVPFFRSKDIKEISKNDVEKFQLHLAKDHNAKGTNLIIGALKAIFREAIKDEYILKSPCEFIKTLSVDSGVETFWSRDELSLFLQVNFHDDLYDLFLIAMNTGMRKGELAGLCWDRVNFSNNTIHVTRTRDRHELKERTKTNRKRTLSMNEVTRTTLIRLKNKQSNSKFVFLLKDGEPIKPHHVYRNFHKAQKKAGMTKLIRFHDLRHTYASLYVNDGGSLYKLQSYLGHTDVKMTTRYAHHSTEGLHEGMKWFNLGTAREIESEGLQTNVICMKKEDDETRSETNSNQILTTKIF